MGSGWWNEEGGENVGWLLGVGVVCFFGAGGLVVPMTCSVGVCPLC